MSKIKTVNLRGASELAAALGLSPADAVEMDIRRMLNARIIAAVAKTGLTHAEVAERVLMSRSRVTAILNRNTQHVSTDLMLRILAALGYRARITFFRTPRAA